MAEGGEGVKQNVDYKSLLDDPETRGVLKPHQREILNRRLGTDRRSS